MEIIFQKLRSVTKFFGIILLTGAGVLGMMGVIAFLLTVLISFYDYTKSNVITLTESKSPKIEFYHSDFLPAGSIESVKLESVRPKDANQLAAEKIINYIMPKYTAIVEEAVNSGFAVMKFKNDELKKIQEDKNREQIEKTVEQFKTLSTANVIKYINKIKETDYNAYTDGLIKYLSNAEKAGVEVYTIDKKPIRSFDMYTSKVFQKYHQDFIEMEKEMKLTEGDTVKGVFNILKTELLYLYLGLFVIFSTMVLILVMNKWILIGKEGQLAFEPQFEKDDDFSEGLALIEKDGKYGYVNRDGDIVIKPQFDEAENFSKGVARVSKGGQWGKIKNPLTSKI